MKYRLNSNYKGLEANDGTYLGDLAWPGDRLRVFSLGNSTHFGRMGMSYTTVLETDSNGERPLVLYDLNESCYGNFVDGFDVLVTPLFMSGARKGKSSVLNVSTLEEAPAALPRGYAGFQPFSVRDGKVWFAGGGGWSDWQNLRVDAGDGCRIVACIAA